MTGARPSLGSSSSSKRGVAHQRAGDGQHLLLAAAHAAAEAVAHAAEVGEQVEQALFGPGGAAGAWGLAADLQVLGHGQVGEDAAFLGHVAEAGAGDAVGFPAGDVGAGEVDAAGGGADDADQRLHGGALAGAVAAEQDQDLAGGEGEGDALQDVGAAVIGVEVGQRQHQWPPLVAPEPR